MRQVVLILKLFKAEADKSFDMGSGISNFTVNPTNIENLAILGKVWGFLKYYHPTVAKGDYNWDYELFRILPEIIRSQSDLQINKILLNWITSLGEFPREESDKADTSLINLLPDFTWINNSKFGEELIGKLNAIRKAKRPNEHYYIDFVPGVGNPQFKNEKPYTQITLMTDAGYRLLALFRYWNIIQYYSPNKNLIEENWNNVLKEIPFGQNSTRLITKLRTKYTWTSFWIIYYLIYDLGDIIMMSKCMKGIKRRAEKHT